MLETLRTQSALITVKYCVFQACREFPKVSDPGSCESYWDPGYNMEYEVSGNHSTSIFQFKKLVWTGKNDFFTVLSLLYLTFPFYLQQSLPVGSYFN